MSRLISGGLAGYRNTTILFTVVSVCSVCTKFDISCFARS